MSDKEIELAVKLTEIKFKNYTFNNFCDSSFNVLDYFEKALNLIKKKGWLDD